MKSEYVETLNTKNITDGINTLEEQVNQAWKINLGILPEVSIRGWTRKRHRENMLKEKDEYIASHILSNEIYEMERLHQP